MTRTLPWKGDKAAMKNTVIGIVIGMLLLLAGERSYSAYRWKQSADEARWRAEQAYLFLTEPVLRDHAGKLWSRAQVLDRLIAMAPKPAAAKE